MIPTPLVLVIELARVERVDDPFAFRFVPQDYLVRAEGGGFSRIHLNWDQAWLDDLAALQRPTCSPELLQRIGERLYRFVANAGWSEQSAAVDAILRAGGQVLVSIRSAAAELYSLPWELLTVGPSGSHLAELDRVLLRYEWPESTTAPEHAPPRERDGRILVAWSAAAGAVPAMEHVDAIAHACSEGHRPFDRDRDVLAHATPGRIERALAEALARGPAVDVLHILCHAHGGADGGLLLDSDDGEGMTRVDPGSLRRLLRPFAGMVRLVVFAACESADPGPQGNNLGSLTQVLHRAGFAAVIGARTPLAVSSSILFTRALYRGLAVSLMSLEQAMVAARQRLAAEPGAIAWATLQLYARAADGDDARPLVVQPYRGLLAFQPEHRRLLFGRDAEIEEIHANLRDLEARGTPLLLVVAGASGTGKSSVVFGGFVPSLLEEPTPWTWARMRPGAEPIRALAATTSRLCEAAIADDPGSIAAALLGWCRDRPDRRLLLVVDQLEELFTQGVAEDEKGAFARLLWQLPSEARRSLTIIATLRVDFVGHCGDLLIDDDGLRLDRIAYDEGHRVFVPRGDRRVLREVIEAPARAVGLSFETGLVERILDDVEGEPGALPLLGHALNLLWESRSGRVLTLAVYRQIGEISGALGRHADAVITALSPEEQVQARRLLVRLVSGGGRGKSDTRSRLSLSRLRPAGDSAEVYDRVAQHLTASRLLVISESEARPDEPSEPMIEVAHEALLRGWPRLQRWIEEDHERLLEIARLDAWLVDFYQRGTILDDARLSFAEKTAATYPDDVSEQVSALVEASVEAREERRRLEEARRVELEASLFRARKNSVMVALVAFVALLFGLLAVDVVEELELESQRRVDDPLFSLLDRLPAAEYRNRLAVLSLVAAPHDRLEWIVAADETLATLPEQWVIGDLKRGTGPYENLQISPDGDWAVLWSRDSVAAYDLNAPKASMGLGATSTSELPDGAELRTSLVCDGHKVHAIRDDDALMLWDPGDPMPMKPSRRGLSLPSAVVACDGHQLAFAGGDAIDIVDLRDPTRDTHLELDDAPVSQLLFADEGASLLAISSEARTIRLWYLGRDETPTTFTCPTGVPLAAALAGGDLRAITDDGKAFEWSPERPEEMPRVVDLGRAPIRLAELNPRGSRVAIATDDYFGVESLTGTGSLPLPGLTDPVISAAWSPSGDQVFAIDRQQLRSFWADGRSFNLSGAKAPEHVATVWRLTDCLDQGELRALFNRFDLGDLLRTINPDRCVANQTLREVTTEELSAKAFFLLLFALELGLLVARMVWGRRRRAIVFNRDVLSSRLPPLAMMAAALFMSSEIVKSGLGRSVGSTTAGIFVLGTLGVAWLVRAAIRLNVGILDGTRPYRVSRRVLQGLALLLGVALTLIALGKLGEIIAPLDLDHGLGIHEATRVMFVLIAGLLVAMYSVSLARADNAHRGVAPHDSPPELPKALRLLRERGLAQMHDLDLDPPDGSRKSDEPEREEKGSASGAS